jgi:cytochrome c-type biogenesis protein CcmH/NrfG
MRRLLRMDTAGAALLHFAGDAAVSIGDEGLALALYRRALAEDPSRPSPRVAIARLLRRRGDFQAARLELFAALAVVPNLREATLELVRVALSSRRVRSVLGPLTRHCATTPTDIEALLLLVELLVFQERDSDARVTLDRVLRHDAAHPAALWFDGVLLVRQARVREAADRWRRIAGDHVFAERARDALARLASTAAGATHPVPVSPSLPVPPPAASGRPSNAAPAPTAAPAHFNAYAQINALTPATS